MDYTYYFMPIGDLIIPYIDEKKCLIDTGSPVSFGGCSLLFGPRTYELSESVGDLDMSSVRPYVSGEPDVLIGGDILKDFCLTIAFLPGEVVISETAKVEHPDAIPLYMAHGVPTVEVIIGGKKCTAFVDTGARISYASSRLIGDAASLAGMVRDFYPGYGEFDVHQHELPLELGSFRGSAVFAGLPDGNDITTDGRPVFHMPHPVRRLLRAAGCDAILGLDMLAKLTASGLSGCPGVVQINYPGRTLTLLPGGLPSEL